MKTVLFFLISVLSWPVAAVPVLDDAGASIELPQPARRIISLAPHITELLFAAGAGDRIVGTVEYSDYPRSALAIPRIGSALHMDLERIIDLQPDLVIVWRSGNPAHQIERLRDLGIPVFVTEPRTLDSIPVLLTRFGKLAGTQQRASEAVDAYRQRLAALRASVSNTLKLRVFYQVSLTPLYTVNGDHIISEIIDLCGGVNAFAPLKVLAPLVSLEAVLQARPEVILVAEADSEHQEVVSAYWSAWKTLPAVEQGHVFFIDPDVISRATPRILSGAEAVCRALDTARQRR